MWVNMCVCVLHARAYVYVHAWAHVCRYGVHAWLTLIGSLMRVQYLLTVAYLIFTFGIDWNDHGHPSLLRKLSGLGASPGSSGMRESDMRQSTL